MAMAAVQTDDASKIMDNFTKIATNRSQVAIFAMDTFGPAVLASQKLDHIITIDGEEFLQNLSVNIMVSIGQGHAFSEGIFELPAGNSREYRLLVISFRFADDTALDPRLQHANLCQVAIFVPRHITFILPANSVFEDKVVNFVKSHLPNVLAIQKVDLEHLKSNIFRLIQDYI